ncbi:cell wall hydrolase/autolysin [Calothrix sp. NIES-4071]|nr:cell wall hydrolase/autolysin [Calothrix sp. NIES-4071]BAZ61078.1 cell wall hydrolase/autolysin [Calothrix sp. NIES-4105]
MGRIFISAAHGGRENGRVDPGTIAGGTTEAREMILLRNLIVNELRGRNWQVLSVPDALSAQGTINWINARAGASDVALEIQTDAAPNPSVRGASVFYVGNNQERKNNAELLLLGLIQSVSQLPNRGTRPDSSIGTSGLAFCRQVSVASLVMPVGFLTSPDDRRLLQTRRSDFASGIARGLISWSRVIDPGAAPSEPEYPSINININGKNYPGRGILVSGSAYMPTDLADELQVNLSSSQLGRITYKGTTYVKAVDLKSLGVSVGWDSATRTLNLKSGSTNQAINEIMGSGRASEVQLHIFLRSKNESGAVQFPDIPALYIEEARIEGVNHDIAFCQMCLETDYLRFSGDIKPQQNNFAGLGTVEGGSEIAIFTSARIGVRAHIQHLKAYASSDPLSQEVVDPRFRFVTRGVAPIVEQLSGRWSADRNYGAKILDIVRQLYQSAGL